MPIQCAFNQNRGRESAFSMYFSGPPRVCLIIVIERGLALLTPVVTTARRPASKGVGILALGVVIALLYYGRVFFITVIIAAILSFLLDPAVLFFMRLKLPRGLASFFVCSLRLLLLYLSGL